MRELVKYRKKICVWFNNKNCVCQTSVVQHLFDQLIILFIFTYFNMEWDVEVYLQNCSSDSEKYFSYGTTNTI